MLFFCSEEYVSLQLKATRGPDPMRFVAVDDVTVSEGHCISEYDQMSPVRRKPTFWFPTWSDTNQAVQLQKIARCLKFRIKKVEGSYYQCSANKGADQLRGYREADLRLCFRICKTLVFSQRQYRYDNTHMQ